MSTCGTQPSSPMRARKDNNMTEEIEALKRIMEQAKRMHLNKFKYNGTFITFDVANRMLKKAKSC